MFRKEYYGNLAYLLRKGMVVAAKASERVSLFRNYAQGVQIPDLIVVRQESLRLVIKSIVALGHANLFLRASPGSRAIIVVGHPCGHVSSVLRGIEMRKGSGTRVQVAAGSRIS